MRNRSFVPQKATKHTFPLAQCQPNETEACPSRGSHAITHTQIQTYLTVLHLTSQTHHLMVLLISIVWMRNGNHFCLGNQYVHRHNTSGKQSHQHVCLLDSCGWSKCGKKKAWASHLEPLSHKEDLSQLEEPFSFMFKVGEEASKSLLSWSMTLTHHRQKEWTPARMTPVMANTLPSWLCLEEWLITI